MITEKDVKIGYKGNLKSVSALFTLDNFTVEDYTRRVFSVII